MYRSTLRPALPLTFLCIAVLLTTINFVRAAELLHRRQWKIDGVTREALLHLPASLTNKPAPVVFAFHGHGGSMRNAARMFHIESLWPDAVVVYPQGLNTPGRLTDPEGKKPGWQRTAGDQDDRDLKFTDAVLASLKGDYSIDSKRVYSTGHSNGGAFTYLLWQTRAKHFAAFAPSASLLPAGSRRGAAPISDGTNTEKTRWPGAPQDAAILHIAGENDELVKYAWQNLFLETLRKQNECGDGQPWNEDNRCTIYKSKTGGDVITFIHPGTHKYPEEAPEIIVKFFKEHRRD